MWENLLGHLISITPSELQGKNDHFTFYCVSCVGNKCSTILFVKCRVKYGDLSQLDSGGLKITISKMKSIISDSLTTFLSFADIFEVFFNFGVFVQKPGK